MTRDWMPAQPDPARRLFQVRLAVTLLALPKEHLDGLNELAYNLERKYTEDKTPRIRRVRKGN